MPKSFLDDLSFILFFKSSPKDMLIVIREEEGRNREGEKHQCETETDQLPLVHSPTGEQTLSLGGCSDWESYPRHFGL